MNQFKRFYIFTGKGGVGKTTTALAFCRLLKEKNKKHLFVTLENNKLESETKSSSLAIKSAMELGISSEELELETSVKGYIAKKLGSETIAKWIVKTPFFQSLINMIPGFSYVIYLGYLLEKLINDPDLIIVLDSPSSGHALTMLEATKNFNKIFEGGVVYEDTKLMLETLIQKDFTHVNIITLPTLLAINEANELKETILSIDPNYAVGITCNNCLVSFDSDNHPEFLKNKIKNETTALNSSTDKTVKMIPHSLAKDTLDLTKDLVPSMESLV